MNNIIDFSSMTLEKLHKSIINESPEVFHRAGDDVKTLVETNKELKNKITNSRFIVKNTCKLTQEL